MCLYLLILWKLFITGIHSSSVCSLVLSSSTGPDQRLQQNTAGKNIISAPKCKLNFGTQTFLYWIPYSYSSSNFAVAKVVTLNLFASFFVLVLHINFASFSYCPPYSYCSSNYRNSDSCHSFSISKEKARSKGKLIAIASKNYYCCKSCKWVVKNEAKQRLRAIFLQEAIEKSPMLPSQYWGENYWIAP